MRFHLGGETKVAYNPEFMPKRSKLSVTEQPLPFSYDEEATEEGVTALAGCGKTPILGRIRNCIYVESIGEAV
ncbi:MAG: hypothetical protein ACM3S5_05730 [Rhodospirillales bacterium]